MAEAHQNTLQRAAELITNATAVLVTSGAGMGVPSGIGTFRGGTAGVWEGYAVNPQYDYTHMTNPDRFVEDPHFAWSFWQWKYNRYVVNIQRVETLSVNVPILILR
jgi:NAD-dependent SIR2 family protein deacetylase